MWERLAEVNDTGGGIIGAGAREGLCEARMLRCCLTQVLAGLWEAGLLAGWMGDWLKSGVRGGGIFSAQGTKAERAGGRCAVLWIQGGACRCQQGVAAWAGVEGAEGDGLGPRAACFLGEGKQRGVHARMETGLVW